MSQDQLAEHLASPHQTKWHLFGTQPWLRSVSYYTFLLWYEIMNESLKLLDTCFILTCCCYIRWWSDIKYFFIFVWHALQVMTKYHTNNRCQTALSRIVRVPRIGSLYVQVYEGKAKRKRSNKINIFFYLCKYAFLLSLFVWLFICCQVWSGQPYLKRIQIESEG